MLLAVLLMLCAAVFPVQLFLCVHSKKMGIKMIPLFLVLIFILCCAVIAVPALHLTGEDGRLAALIAMFLGFFMLAADGVAWLIYGIVKAAQKLKKIFVV